MARVLGVDPGFASFGWCIVDLRREGDALLNVGVIRTKKASAVQNVMASDDNLQRARVIYRELANLCDAYDVRLVAAEAMSFVRHASAAAKVSITWGVLASLTEERQLPLVQIAPQALKKLVAGAGASKEAVQAAVRQRFPGGVLDAFSVDTPGTEHEHGFDAIAVVIACSNSEVFRMARG